MPGAALATVLLTAAIATAAVGDRILKLTRQSPWTQVRTVPIGFRTYHPQGMVKVGETLFLSSVHVTSNDRSTGVGHLFKLDLTGRLIADLTLGEGRMYHPGGLDYDGSRIWVAVAEYRPDSRSIVYTVDPTAMKATEAFRFGDHLGALAFDPDARSLHGVSWGSRRLYRWGVGRDGRVIDAARPARTINGSHYVDYQDCKYAGRRRMLCTGVSDLQPAPQAPAFRLGGLDLIDLADGRPLHQVPIPLWTTSGLDMTHNPSWFEPTSSGLRAYFMPEDDRSTLYIYEVSTR